MEVLRPREQTRYAALIFPQTKEELEEAVWWACQSGSTDLLLALTEKEVDLNVPNRNGATPFYAACYFGHGDCVP